jgi:phosphoesterase RecJ-like protein
LIVCHLGPDGDCLGSGLALAWTLKRLAVPVQVASADGVPGNLTFLPGASEVITDPDEVRTPQVAVTMECSTLDRAGRFEPAVRGAPVIIAIDHHAELASYAHLEDWDPSAAAIGQQVAGLIDQLGVPVDRTIAICLQTALVTDTGVFRYSNATPQALRLAADLAERDAPVAEVVRHVYERQPASTLRLLGYALAGMSLHHGGAVAVAAVGPDMLGAAGARPGETSGIAAVLRTIDGVRLAMTFEDDQGVVRISVRSRDGVRADRVARGLGGGGHPQAAGADVRGSLEDTLRRALALAAIEIETAAHDEPTD